MAIIGNINPTFSDKPRCQIGTQRSAAQSVSSARDYWRLSPAQRVAAQRRLCLGARASLARSSVAEAHSIDQDTYQNLLLQKLEAILRYLGKRWKKSQSISKSGRQVPFLEGKPAAVSATAGADAFEGPAARCSCATAAGASSRWSGADVARSFYTAAAATRQKTFVFECI